MYRNARLCPACLKSIWDYFFFTSAKFKIPLQLNIMPKDKLNVPELNIS